MTMIERVARALAKLNQDEPPDHIVFDCGCCERDGTQAKYLADAKAAIEAMREPTPDMLEMCWGVYPESDGEGGAWINQESAHYLWQSMIEEALKDPAGPPRPLRFPLKPEREKWPDVIEVALTEKDAGETK